jgi:hypothetical protein
VGLLGLKWVAVDWTGLDRAGLTWTGVELNSSWIELSWPDCRESAGVVQVTSIQVKSSQVKASQPLQARAMRQDGAHDCQRRASHECRSGACRAENVSVGAGRVTGALRCLSPRSCSVLCSTRLASPGRELGGAWCVLVSSAVPLRRSWLRGANARFGASCIVLRDFFFERGPV